MGRDGFAGFLTLLIDNVLILEPMASTRPSETHAALVVSRQTFSNVTFRADYRTLAQLRTGSSPNPWETAWAVFGYTDNTQFYYVAFKTNGWELGKADSAYPGAQRFLATGDIPASPIGADHRFDIKQDGATITVHLDGALLTTFTDSERPYLSGKVGFYTEDARVAFDNVAGSISDDFESYPSVRVRDGAMIGTKWEVQFVGYGYAGIAQLAPAHDILGLPGRGADRE
jgi:hypothetical protein